MFKGFYNLTSGMLSQGRRLDVVSNNMSNVGTAGYRADQYTDNTAFKQAVLSRIGNQDKRGAEEIGNASYILAPDQLYTDFSQGSIEETGVPYDFAIEGDGFFAIQTANGTAYSRGGAFSLDDEGYLYLSGKGRVLSVDGQPMQIITDKITADNSGSIYTDQGAFLGRVGVYTFADNAALTRNPQGLFVGAGATVAEAPIVHWQSLERSNVDFIKQMVAMMTSQRAYQSAAQVSKIYDQLMTKSTTDIGRL